MALPVRPLRFSGGVSAKNAMPELELCDQPFTDMPANSTASCTPGVFSPISAMRRTTASVRSIEEAGGSCATAIRYCLSWSGMKPPGTALKPNQVRTIRPA